MTQLSLGQQLRDALEQDILLGALKPGERLDELGLAARFKVSRTPVREALAQLSSSGLVEVRPRRGAIVRGVSLAELVEMFEVMAELEAMCGRLAARRMSEPQRQALLAAHERCGTALAAGDENRYYYDNETFHGVIYAACGNRFLVSETERLRNRLKPYRRLQLRVPHRMNDSYSEHRAIVDAILARDEAAIGKVIRKHIMIQGERFNELLASMGSARHAASF